uniref:Aminopeptidase n=1 Tax=Odontella aurita TaxID=265563 RepID=A0A7S4NEL5_9STRA|mmetsp:Transcript_60373/g.178794  ORF Transcript_60373/g.178794 Transcript_60373/m.178794 type:complete len:907 (+) Transcript_60373:92-2812(+)
MTADGDKKAEGRVLLPSTIVPSRYDLKLTPNLETFNFIGEVTVRLNTTSDLGEECNEITMHAKELGFMSANYVVEDGDGTKHEAEEIIVNTKKTTVTFRFPSPLPPSSTLSLHIHYTGVHNNQMAGFYRSSYTDIHGKSKIMVSTQFEALDARRCFPCWDEPARKASFGVTLIVDKNLTAFSNMPESRVKTLEGGTKAEITYLDTPVMSTYLLAICVGEFDYVQTQTQNGVLVRVYTPPGKSASGTFALDCASKSLDLYDSFFGTRYPLPKLDMVAIPEFAMGAMENWGLVTYREVDILIDPTTASNSQKQRVTTVVTHELAHQWFGNLVTMEWWDDLWLNEGFASWAENWCLNEIHPEYLMWDQFVVDHFSAALRLDALRSSHPIQVPIRHAEEVEQVFDAISYCKGGSVVRMIKGVLGFDAFQKGLSAYMKQHAYGNTETFHLWNAWEESSGMPVGEWMKSWTEQMGFPLVKVVSEKWEDDKVTLVLEQSWFLADGSELSEEEKEKKWTIPVLTCTAEGTQEDMVFMREKTATVTVPLTSTDGWVKINAGQVVPMRVLPTPTMIQRISSAIQSKSLPSADRAGLVADAYALVKCGAMSPEDLIKLLSSYGNEDEYIVWKSIADVLGGLDTILGDDESMHANFTSFARGMVTNLASKVGWEAPPSSDESESSSNDNDGHLTVLLRGMMIGLLGTFAYDDPDVRSEALRRFRAFQENPNDVASLPSDMRAAVFKIYLKSAANGSTAEYDHVKSYYASASDNAERKHVLASLGHAPSDSLKRATMEWSTSGEIKVQDFFYAMGSVGRSSKRGREISWEYLKAQIERMEDMIGKGSPSLMDACVVSCAGAFCSREKADEIETFFKEHHPLPKSERKITQMVESMRANAKFLDILRESGLSKDEFWKGL